MSGQPKVGEWANEVTAIGDRIGRHFARSEPRERAAGYVRGLLGDAERKNERLAPGRVPRRPHPRWRPAPPRPSRLER